MQSLLRAFPKILFLLFGGVVVVLSLLSANRLLSRGEGLQLARQQLYFGGSISPDHLLYPAVIAIDWLDLAVAGPEQSVELKLEYAHRRLEHTRTLLERGYYSLSFSTLTKSYKYYNEALSEANQLPLTQQQQMVLLTNSQAFREQVQQLFPNFDHDQQQELVRLSGEQKVLEQLLIDSL